MRRAAQATALTSLMFVLAAAGLLPLAGPRPAAAGVCNGPDTQGYTCTDVSRPFIQGTVDSGNHFDDNTTPIALPFPFTYYGVVFNTGTISSNGNLQFASNNNMDNGPAIMAAAGPAFNQALFPFWADLQTNNQAGVTDGCNVFPLVGTQRCGVYTALTGAAPNRTFTLEWRACFFNGCNNNSANFEIQLEETTNNLYFVYGISTGQNANGEGNGSQPVASGIQGLDGSNGRFLNLSFNQPVLTPGRAVRFSPGVAPAPPAAPACTLFGAAQTMALPNNRSNLLTIDPNNGVLLSTVGPIGFQIQALANNPVTGELYGTTTNTDPTAPNSLIRINKATGAGTLVGVANSLMGTGVSDLSFGAPGTASAGTLYGLQLGSGDLYTINLNTGFGSRVGPSGQSLVSALNTANRVGSAAPGGLAFSTAGSYPSAQTMFTTSDADRVMNTIDPTTALPTSALLLTNTNPTSPPIPALTFNPNTANLVGVRALVPGVGGATELLNITRGGAVTAQSSVAGLNAIEFDCTGLPPTVTPTPTATATPTATPSATPCILGDINCDGIVDIRDYGIWRQNFGQTNCGNPADLDGNCIVDIRDYGIWRANFGHTSGAAARTATPLPAPRGIAVPAGMAPRQAEGAAPSVPIVPLVGGLLGLGGLAGWRRRRPPGQW
jgi:MYXO-CTERM domain-containing protein